LHVTSAALLDPQHRRRLPPRDASRAGKTQVQSAHRNVGSASSGRRSCQRPCLRHCIVSEGQTQPLLTPSTHLAPAEQTLEAKNPLVQAHTSLVAAACRSARPKPCHSLQPLALPAFQVPTRPVSSRQMNRSQVHPTTPIRVSSTQHAEQSRRLDVPGAKQINA
jgi:hypothetical protein